MLPLSHYRQPPKAQTRSPLLWWTVAGHCALFAVWCFLVIFGNVMEDAQVRRLDLSCGAPAVAACNPDHVFGIDGECCASEPYQNAYNILSVVGGTLAAAHVAYFLEMATVAFFMSVGGILFVFHQIARGGVFAFFFVGIAYVYQHLAYNVFFCRHDAAYCAHHPSAYWVVLHLAYSLLALGTPYLFLQVCRVATLATVFAVARQDKLSRVVDLEKKLDVLGEDHIQGTFSRRIVSRYRNLRTFMERWISRDDDDVHEHIQNSARRLMDELLAEVSGSAPDQNTIGFRDFHFALATRGTPQDEIREAWDFMIQHDQESLSENAPELRVASLPGASWHSPDTRADVVSRAFGAHELRRRRADHEGGKETEMVQLQHQRQRQRDDVPEVIIQTSTDEGGKTDAERAKEVLSVDGIADVLYDLFFVRKEVIHSIYTDHYVITFLARMLGIIIYPAAFIAVSRIFGYENAFGTGVDLFKVYMLSVSYIMTSFKDDAIFLVTMLALRPFNIGDILLLGNQTYKVRRLSLTHFFLDGPHHLSVPNSRFSSNATINLSKQGNTDSLRVAFPPNVDTTKVTRERFFRILAEYQSAHPRDVSRASIRCGWADAPDGSSKIMQCNWRYKFRVFERGRLNWARANIRDFIISSVEEDLSDAFMKTHVAGGGGFNDWPKTRGKREGGDEA